LFIAAGGDIFAGPMPAWPDAVLFDFDGVLVNSEPLHFRALQKAAAESDLSLSEDDYYNELLGHDDRGAFQRLLTLNQRRATPALLLKLMARKQVIAAQLIFEKQFRPLPGVGELVRSLWREYPLAICSGARSNEIELMLEAIGLRDCFRVIISAEDVTVGKPDPESYLRGLEMLARRYHTRLNPKNCIVIEDAPRVIDRLKPHGFICVGVASHIPAVRFNNADYVVEALTVESIKKTIPKLELFEEIA
jgi:HAD superfamily hydrolase (TIGR01509 family)